MRVTKADFEFVVREMSKVYGRQLYLVQGYHYMYVSITDNTVLAQENSMLETSASFSKANLDIFRAYLAGMTRNRFSSR